MKTILNWLLSKAFPPRLKSLAFTGDEQLHHKLWSKIQSGELKIVSVVEGEGVGEVTVRPYRDGIDRTARGL